MTTPSKNDIILNGQIASFWNVRDELKHMTKEELQEETKKDTLPYAVCFVNIAGDLNIGVMLRTAHLMGAEKIFIAGRKKYDKRSTVGAENYSNIEYINCSFDVNTLQYDSDELLDIIHMEGYTAVAVEQVKSTNKRIHMDTIVNNIHSHKPCFIFGSESYGLPAEITDQVSVYTISQHGVLRSFNVSAAAAIVMSTFRERLYHG